MQEISADSAHERLNRAEELAICGQLDGAREVYQSLFEHADPHHKARILNDLAVLDAIEEQWESARSRLSDALSINATFATAHENLTIVEDSIRSDARPIRHAEEAPIDVHSLNENSEPRKTRIAILSILFNWPSTGGGTIHTAETGQFLLNAGYDVRHIYAVFPPWEIGRVDEPTGVPRDPLLFDPTSWNARSIQERFREAVDQYSPDYVIITDSWNFKPLLANAMSGYRYFLRIAALECLCPLNNVRLLANGPNDIRSCPRHQLATPDTCRSCVAQREHQSGMLHRAERALSGYGTAEYDASLRKAFAEAEGVLAVNPLIAEMMAPYSKAVHAVPSGFDEARFPWPHVDEEKDATGEEGKKGIFFAGLTQEFMKGFHLLRAACERLWEKRQDFELVATGNANGQPKDPFIRYVGWLSQKSLPEYLRKAEMLVFPTLAEEALGRSAVEAMGAGRPVIASRIGGLQFTVTDGATGLLFEPGNVDDLTAKIERLLDDPELCRLLGRHGRRRFEEEFTWDVIIKRHYKQLFQVSSVPEVST